MKNHIKTIAVFCFALLVAACGSDEQKRFEQSTRMVRDVYVNTSMTVYAGQSYYIQGVGFEKGDLLSFRSDEGEVEIPVQDATPKTACIIIPEALGKGTYRLWIERGEREQFLSVVKVYLTSHFDVPDKEGATIKGAVFCRTEVSPACACRMVSLPRPPTKTDITGLRRTNRPATSSIRCRRATSPSISTAMRWVSGSR